MVSNKVMPELVEYPEDGTIRAMTRGRFDPPKADEDLADHLNLQFKRSDAEEQQFSEPMPDLASDWRLDSSRCLSTLRRA